MSVPGNIQPKISAIKARTLVIHGIKDLFNSVEAGKEIASTICGAKLLLLDGIRHSFPRDFLG